MSKAIITHADWQNLEEVLMRLRIGYEVKFDDHHGVAEMLIDVNTISVMRWGEGNEPAAADWSVDEAKPVEIEEGI